MLPINTTGTRNEKISGVKPLGTSEEKNNDEKVTVTATIVATASFEGSYNGWCPSYDG